MRPAARGRAGSATLGRCPKPRKAAQILMFPTRIEWTLSRRFLKVAAPARKSIIRKPWRTAETARDHNQRETRNVLAGYLPGRAGCGAGGAAGRQIQKLKPDRRHAFRTTRNACVRAQARRRSPTRTIFMVLVPPDMPIGSPKDTTMRSPGSTMLFSTSTCSASSSSASRSCPW